MSDIPVLHKKQPPQDLYSNGFMGGFDTTKQSKQDQQDVFENINSNLRQLEEPNTIRNQRQALLKAGAAGTAAVYIGDKLSGLEKELTDEKGGFLKNLGAGLSNALGKLGLGGLAGKAGRVLGGKAARMGGGALFAGLTLTDLLGEGGGLELFKEGKIGKGILTTALGREAETDKGVGKNMLKQGAKWGGFGMMVAGPAGAAIGAGIGALAAGIKGAFEMEFDKRTEEFATNIRNIWEDPEAGIGTKLWTTTKETAKAALGVLTGGLREAGEGIKERVGKIKEVWADESATTLEKVGKTAMNVIVGVGETGFNLIKGVVQSGEKFIVGLLSEENKKKWKDWKKKVKETAGGIMDTMRGAVEKGKEYTSDFFDTLSKRGLRGIGETKVVQDIKQGIQESQEKWAQRWETLKGSAGDAWENFKGNVGNSFEVAKEKWQSFVGEVKEKGLVGYLKDKWEDAKVKLGEFANSVKNLWDTFTSFIGNIAKQTAATLRTQWKNLLSGGYEATVDVLGRYKSGEFGKGDQATEALIKQLMGIKEFRRYVEDVTGENVFNLAGGIKKGKENIWADFIKNNLGDFFRLADSEAQMADDFILTKDGQLIKTNKNDTLFGTQAFDDGAMNNMMKGGNGNVTNQLLNVLQSIDRKTGQGGMGGQVIQQNFSSRFSPDNIMKQLRVSEVQ